MDQAPYRHLLFLSVLLFIILSSGSLQCALNCYENATQAALGDTPVTDCHPLSKLNLESGQTPDFCHRNHSSSQANNDPEMSSLARGPALALFSSRIESPKYSSAEPFSSPLMAANLANFPAEGILPLSQTRKQIRSTILLM